MLRGWSGVVATAGLCVIAALPAEARRPGPAAGERQGSGLQVASRGHEAMVLSGIGRPRRGQALPLVPTDRGRDPRDSLGDLRTAPPRTVMLRSVPVLERVDLGVGLFAVTGATQKERELRRTDPIRDVAPRTSRVAGAGLRVNF